MQLAEALRRRRMVRHYSGSGIESGALERIVAAGMSAPSAGDSQGVAVVVVTAPDRIAAVAAACGEPEWLERGFDAWLSTAGAHLVICLEPEVYRRRYSADDKDPEVLDLIPWWWVDGGAALEAVLLAAVAEGLGAGFHGGHRSAGARALLGIPDEVVILGIVTVGHPSPARRKRTRSRTVREGRVHRDHW